MVGREDVSVCHGETPPELLANLRYNSCAAVVGWRVPCRVGFWADARNLSAGN